MAGGKYDTMFCKILVTWWRILLLFDFDYKPFEIIRKAWMVALVSIIWTVIVLNFYSVYLTYGELQAALQCAFMAFGCLTSALKFMVQLWKRNDVLALMKYLDYVYLTFERHMQLPERLLPENAEKKIDKVVKWFYIIFVAVAILFVMTPYVTDACRHYFAGEKREHALLFTSWPYNTSRPYIYEATYAVQALDGLFQTMLNANITLTCYVMTYHVGMRFEIVQHILLSNKDDSERRVAERNSRVEAGAGMWDTHSFADFDATERTKRIRVKNSQANEHSVDCIPQEVVDEMRIGLRSTIKYHHHLISMSSRLKVLMSPALLTDILICLQVFCMAGFLFSVAENSDNKFRYIQIIVWYVNILFITCWLCTDLTFQSGQVSQAAYMSPWLDAPDDYKSMLTLVMVRAQNPAFLTAGDFTRVTLETFLKVLQIAYSNYAVLQELNS